MTSTTLHGENHGIQIGNNYGSVTEESRAYSSQDIDRICLQKLCCPDSLAVKNRLKEAKDKLLRQSFEWVLQDPQYRSWRHGNDVCLLWIKGGAGKGKTMMSIGLIEVLSQRQDISTVVTYFFCQNADSELNTLESVIKGLILRLVSQRIELKESLRRRWDPKSNRFSEDVSSWRALWSIFLEMLDKCNGLMVYIIVDALDECQDSGMADFLKLVVRNGLDQPTKIKWLLTSRPLEAAERILLAGHEQMQVSLELNSDHISQSVQTYISYKVDELNRQKRYEEALMRKLKAELSAKAEGTFLWVSLVCKRLESIGADEVLNTLQDLPPGLHPFYDRILNQLHEGQPNDVYDYMRLLKAMMLVYRPLKVEEVPSVTGLSLGDDRIKLLVNHYASFIRMQGNIIEFVHQSARDYLAGESGLAILNSHGHYEHYDIVLNCLSYLCGQLKVNLMDLPRPDSTSKLIKSLKSERKSILLSSLDYATTFWVQHLQKVPLKIIAQSRLIEEGLVGLFLHTKLLEWLECFSLLDRLPKALESIRALIDITKRDSPVLALMQDATRFLLRHFYNMAHWPLQIYSSALIFSPETSIVRIGNLDKIPKYFKCFPRMESTWASLIQTLEGHSIWVTTVAFSPDGKQIASGSDDTTIKLWDSTTGDLQKTLEGHSYRVTTVAFSPDGKQIASGSVDSTIKLWDSTTGDLQKTLEGHSHWVTTVAFSPDGKQIASGSADTTIKLWDSTTGDLQKTLEGHSHWVTTVAFSPDGKQIASGSYDTTIKLWDSTIGDLQKTLEGHSNCVTTVAFSPDGKQIASGSYDTTIKLWDSTTGDLQKTLEGHSYRVTTVAFSPDGKQIASGSADNTIKLWDSTTGDLQKTLEGHSREVTTVAFSPDGKQIASGSDDTTIKLWDSTTGDLQKTLEGHSYSVTTVAFSPDGKQIASGSDDTTIKLWDIAKSHKTSKFLGRRLGSRFKLRSRKEIETSEPVHNLKFSADNLYLITGTERIRLEDTATEDHDKSPHSLQDLIVKGQWICYGVMPFLRLSSDIQLACQDTYDDKVAIGLGTGQVLTFGFDRSILHSMLAPGAV
ncbi:G-protein beta WD- 40 repeats containing protein [Penicillium taxi]|uniref:G-protein beta WD- 40 repeats containing protein n=1 Tax=Penicillium taxi TaxID=168475 RepID=UPI0025458215|nr:G-protein beta WD- 40 repeats containing protein [Penicillium taxi]KAJ5894292.1 G-protein beta WD- 40 repeats containing protein [Penicillium taxi]